MTKKKAMNLLLRILLVWGLMFAFTLLDFAVPVESFFEDVIRTMIFGVFGGILITYFSGDQTRSV